MSTKKEDPNKKLDELIKMYTEKLNTFSENDIPEIEVKFGTKSLKKINKSNFDNVIQSLLNFNFKQVNKEEYLLRTGLEFTDKKLEQDYKNLRFEINGIKNIQNFCITNQIPDVLDNNHKFINKNLYKHAGITYYPIDFSEYNFRVTYNIESQLSNSIEDIKQIIDNWKSFKKYFRYIKRYRFINQEFPFAIDLSIVKSNTKKYGKFQYSYTLQESDIFNNIESYEVEIEFINTELGIGTKYSDYITIIKILKRIIKYILIGLQDSYFPISLSEQQNVRNEYYKLINKSDYKNKPITPSDFIGPSSVTLQLENIINTDDIKDSNYNISNIRKNYTVTDKADGARKLLFVNNTGLIYFINSSMNIEFTGCITYNNEVFNTIIDGEHIIYDKIGKFINLYMAFDIYFISNKNITGYPFILTDKESQIKGDDTKDSAKDGAKDSAKDGAKDGAKDSDIIYRLSVLNTFVQTINIKSYIEGNIPFIKIERKKFYSGNIFTGNSTILTNINNGLYKYNTDGLIFTPANTGVASDTIGFEAPNYKITWYSSFKWKPPIFNTIDFLVSFKRNNTGGYFIGNKFTNGINLTSNQQIIKYYSLILRVGFDEKRHGYINPCQNIIDNKLPKKETIFGKAEYKPVQFYPTNPIDNDAGICNLELKLNSLGEFKIFTLENEEIEDNSIVEFKYDNTMEQGWRWIPLRIRYDKTNELRSGLNNFGNAYHTANNIWHSIHYPITDEMISNGKGIMNYPIDNDVYYNKNNKITQTKSLRDFHNLYVKNLLIKKLAKPDSTLIDYAVGKGGDLPKWINSNIKYILGIDLSRDNIENRLDGACARYLNYCKKFTKIPAAIFLNGNTSLNIKSGEAFTSDKSKQIVDAIFGTGTKDETILGKGIYKNYGVAINGFNISSIQFALHYMFESKITLHNFMKNLCECTALNGYFIGTCYDGNSVFNLLNKKEKGESVNLYSNTDKIWEITRQYNNVDFVEDESSLGYAIDVYQETINKVFREYLVNYKFLKRILENYGFTELNKEELTELGLKNSSGMFSELFTLMKIELSTDKNNYFGSAENMSEEEKTISFLNRYFIFKKTRNVDPDKIKEQYADELTEQDKQLAIEILESLDK